MQATIDLVGSVKLHKSIDPQNMKMYYTYSTEIAGIIYTRCIERLEEFIDFDGATATLAVECFYVILQMVINNFKDNLISFLSSVGKDTVLTLD